MTLTIRIGKEVENPSLPIRKWKKAKMRNEANAVAIEIHAAAS
jgi:hypothetical protein